MNVWEGNDYHTIEVTKDCLRYDNKRMMDGSDMLALLEKYQQGKGVTRANLMLGTNWQLRFVSPEVGREIRNPITGQIYASGEDLDLLMMAIKERVL